MVGFALSLGAAAIHVATGGHGGTDGYLLFALLGAAYMLLVVVVNVATDLAELGRLQLGLWRSMRLRAAPLLSVGASIAGLVLTTSLAGPNMVAAARWTNSHSQVAADTGSYRAFEILRNTASESIEGSIPPPTAANVTEPATLLPENTQLIIGAYDPWQRLDSAPLGLEHWYVPQNEPELLAGALARAGDRRGLMVTIEPTTSTDQSMPVLARVVSGHADDELRQLARIAHESAPRVVLVRWAHEMDLTLLYPWSGNDPSLYRAAFRHVVEVFRAEGADNVRWVWSPAGESRALAFYPGDDVVDFVGLTVLGDAAWDAEFGYEPRQSMADVLRPRYETVVGLGKPVVVAELGVSGTAAEQDQWLAAAARALTDYPQVRVIVYFNDRNAPNNWRGSQPDWRLADASALLPLVQAERA
jgi:endoglucanase